MKRSWDHVFVSNFGNLENTLYTSLAHCMSLMGERRQGGGRGQAVWSETVEFIMTSFPGRTPVTVRPIARGFTICGHDNREVWQELTYYGAKLM